MFSLLHPGKSPTLVVNGLLISSALLITGCASTEKHDVIEPTTASVPSADTKPVATTSSRHATAKDDQADPLEGFNRPMYDLNMGLDKYFIKHIASGYKYILPDFMETGVTNFFSNLKGINVVLNDTLQGKFGQGAEDTGRFLTNTTLGVGGLFDVASEFGLQSHDEDFGQTLATWGVGGSTYLVLPILGPTTFRDFAGSVTVDYATNPGNYVPGVGVLEGISKRANAEGALNFIDEAALDPYVFTRESYQQYRANLIKDGKVNSSSFDDLDIDAALEETESSAGSQKNAKPVSSDKPKVSNGGNKQPVSPVAASTASQPAFNDMHKSFEQAEQEFAEASEKMDQLAEIKQRRRHRR